MGLYSQLSHKTMHNGPVTIARGWCNGNIQDFHEEFLSLGFDSRTAYFALFANPSVM